jgi:predicted O-methyltransferase YrrM
VKLESALKTDGWMEQVELEYLAETASNSLTIAELGCWKGRSTLALAENTPGVVFAIDVWEDNPLAKMGTGIHGSIFAEFQQNTRELSNVCPIVLDTDRAWKIMSEAGLRFDLIFIDACHEYEQVKRDIQNWKKLLSEGGILCGHDFVGDYPGVAQAVRELIPKFRLVNSIWIMEP